MTIIPLNIVQVNFLFPQGNSISTLNSVGNLVSPSLAVFCFTIDLLLTARETGFPTGVQSSAFNNTFVLSDVMALLYDYQHHRDHLSEDLKNTL